MRGLSELKGSWKTICICAAQRPQLALAAAPAGPARRTGCRPCCASSRSSARPSVVLPEPRSRRPGRACGPRAARALTPSTALTWPTVRRSTPRLIGKCTFRSSSRRISGAVGIGGGRPALGLGRQQVLGVGMLRLVEHLGDRALLDDLALGHHADAVGHLAHDAEVVGDEQQRHAVARLQGLQQLQDLRLDGDVERRGRLVGDQQVGLVGQRHGDHHALALAARELVRDRRRAASPLRGCRPARSSSSVRLRAASRVRPLCRISTSLTCRSIVCSGLSEVIGSWKIIDDAVAAHARSSSRAGAPTSSWPWKRMLPVGWLRHRVGQELQDRQRRHRLARARFADQRQGLAALDRRS